MTYSQVNFFCLFIGDGRSGSTLTSSIIDAHPHAVISLEENIFDLLHRHIKREELYHYILENSYKNRERQWTEYSYKITKQWQGKSKGINVIGDKQAGRFTMTMDKNRDLYRTLQTLTGVPIKVFHSIRNPYDIIATRVKWQTGSKQLSKQEKTLLVDRMIKDHFDICEAALRLRKEILTDIMDVRHEIFINNPEAMVQGICDFLKLKSTNNYIRNCCGIVQQSAHQTRHNIQWNTRQLETVQTQLKKYSFLQGYTY